MSVTVKALRDCGGYVDEYVAQLARWHHDEWLHLNPGATLEKRLLRYQNSLTTTGLPEIFVACFNNELAGSATLDKEDMDTRVHLTPWLASLYVVPEHRGQGIASALIQYIINEARQREFKNIYLFTEDQTEFYKKRGWRLLETVEYRNAEVDLMTQRL